MKNQKNQVKETTKINETNEQVTNQANEAKEQVTKGKFISPQGHTYILEREDTYDMVGKPQKYTMPEAVIYRRKNSEQVELKKQSSVLTKDMKAIKEAFPIAHPNIHPDEVTYNVKCLD